MAGSTFPHNIFMPEASDNIKAASSPSKLAQDISTVAQTANNALSIAQAAAIAKAEQLDAGNRTDWGTAVFDALTRSKEYTDVSFQASGPGGATDAQVDAAVDRAVLGGRVADGSVMALMPSGGRQAVGRGDYGVLASDHGAVPDDELSDKWRIEEAISVANGKDVILEGGKTYLITGTVGLPAGVDTVSLRALGAEPAILKLGGDGQTNSAIKFEQNTVSATTTLTASIGIGTVGWPVASVANIEPGMICEVMSSAPWYHDPRTDSSDARKSELHRVRGTFLGKVYFDDPANDGYDITSETVQLSFYKPIKVRLENITVEGTLLPVAEETKAVIGLEVSHADEPELINVSAVNCARTGVRVFLSYNPKITGGYSRGSNNYWNGYGVSIDGCANAVVRDRITYECRRSIDTTGMHIISRNTTLINCTAVGGGKNSRGDNYGWNPDGTIGAYQGGFGTHGPADQTRYIDCTTFWMSAPYICRGRDEMIINMRHIGSTSGPVVACSTGTNIVILGGWATAGYWSWKNASTYQGGNYASINSKRPEYFIRFYPAYQMNPPTGNSRGRVIIKGVTAEVTNRAIYFDGNMPMGHFTVADNDFFYAPVVSTDDAAMMVMIGTEPVFSKSKWFIGPNRNTLDAGSGQMKTTHNVTLTGANVIDYTVQP